MTLEARIREEYQLESTTEGQLDLVIQRFADSLGRKRPWEIGLFQRVVAGLAAKGFKDWRAGSHLFFGGFEENGEIMSRCLIELVTDMRFIALESERRSRRFTDFGQAYRQRFFNEMVDKYAGRTRINLDLVRKELRTDLAAIFDKYPEWRDNPPTKWAGSRETMAKKCRAIGADLYFLNYMSGSKYVHPHPAVIRRYVDLLGENVELHDQPAVPGTPRLFHHLTIILLDLITQVEAIFGLGMKDQVERVEELLRAMLGNAPWSPYEATKLKP